MKSTDQTICYCHHYTVSDIEKDAVTHGCSTIMKKIIAETKAGNCDCQVNNPKGG